MDMAEQSTTPAFTRLPTELLEMIADYASPADPGYWRIRTLKSLRLTCRQFAYLPLVLDGLFTRVRFVASSQHVAIAVTMNWAALAPHVKHVTFQPDKYSWAMTKEVFEEICVIKSLREKREEHHEMVRMKRREMASGDVKPEFWDDGFMLRNGWRVFVDQYMEGKAPFSEQELNDGFEHYMARAGAARALFDSGEVSRAWAAALRQLPQAEAFTIGDDEFGIADDCKQTKGETSKASECVVYEHEHDYSNEGHCKPKCHAWRAALGEAVFSAAVAGLIAAGSTVVELNIKYKVDGDFKWADDGQLHGLDLSRLRRLFFSPRIVDEYGIQQFLKRKWADVEVHCARAMMALLRASRENLRVLELYNDDYGKWGNEPLSWPPPYEGKSVEEAGEMIELPALECFKCAVHLDLAAFGQFLLRTKNLQHLELVGCCVRGGKWRDVWRAIRHHPSRMQVEVEEVAADSDTNFSISHFTGDKSRRGPDRDDPWQKIDYEMGMYLSNRGRWGINCRKWFDGWYTDSEAEDEDESGGGEYSGSEDGKD